MKIVFNYSVITKEGSVIPNVTEPMSCDTDEEKAAARSRYAELKRALFVKNLTFKTDEVATRRVVRVRYAPGGKVYTFEVDFDVRKNEGLEVDDIDKNDLDRSKNDPNKRVYVFAIEKDKTVPESELGFDPRLLRKAYKAS